MRRLGRAVIGGLVVCDVATLFFVPCVFMIVHRNYKPGAEPGEAALAAEHKFEIEHQRELDAQFEEKEKHDGNTEPPPEE